MTTNEIRRCFLDYFKEKGHAIIPSASLIPENDPTVLFTTAGMHPLVPYLLGQAHPEGKRLASVQKCLRTDDIDSVGDNSHFTFFEMLGNWSLGDYFKRESIAWSFELLTDAHLFGLDPRRLFVTVFEGDADAPQDDESIEIWQAQFQMVGVNAFVGRAGEDEPATVSDQGKHGQRIFTYSKKKNWWGPAGIIGPCGPDTEIFYDLGIPHDSAFGQICHPNCDCGRFIEIWNNVFMEYDKKEDGSFAPLTQKNVDTGMGLERIACISQNVPTVFDTDEIRAIMQAVSSCIPHVASGDIESVERSKRIICDHLRAAVFVIGDAHGVVPSNVGAGYVIRRLIRRAIREARRIGIQGSFLATVAHAIIDAYCPVYNELDTRRSHIVEELNKEEEKFGRTLEKGMKELDKMIRNVSAISGEQAFILFSTYGFPVELTEEIVHERGGSVDRAGFDEEFHKHQKLSRAVSAGTFKGGLADNTEKTTRLHTATHLLQAALRHVLGNHVEQRGSNITVDRLRFDFSHPNKLTPEQLQSVETFVNEMIKRDLPVTVAEMSVDEAKASGAMGLFESRYGNRVKIYTVGDQMGQLVSKEICGGPHVSRTGEIGVFKIIKEESVSAGIRRIKATVAQSV